MSINTNRSSPTQINTSTNNYAMTPKQVGLHWQSVSIGPSHTIAIATDGTLWGWGYNNVGQVGNSSLINQSSPVQIASGSWTHVHADINYSLALRTDDLLFGWGYNQYGQLGSNIPVGDYRSSPVQLNSMSWSTVSSGTNHTVAIKSDSTLWAWGYNNLGQLGEVSYINTSSPTQIGTSSYSQVGAGSNYTTALTTDNKIVTFGDNTYGQLGYNPTSTINSWTMIAGNGEFTLAINTIGLLFGWGLNTTGQLGLNDTIYRSSPTQIGTNSWTFVSSNGGTLGAAPAAIRSDGTLWGWGSNITGEIGDGTTVNKSSPVQVSIGGSWTSVSAGQSHKLAINSAGLLYGWGNGVAGQLGQNNSQRRSDPVQILTSSFMSISANLNSSYGVTNTGKLFVWGAGNFGKLGLNDTINRSSPVQVGSSSWSMVYSTYDGSVYAIKSNNKLYAWGYNYGVRGTLGTDDLQQRSSPVQIHSNDWKTTVNSIAGISLGNTFGIQSDGSLWAWGLATLLLASDFATSTFTYSWTQISSGDSHTVAIRSDGRLFAWGLNNVGQVGINDTINRSSPVQIGTSKNEGEFWYNVSAKGSRTVAVRCDNTIWVWGLNSGYVGLNDSINRSSPVQIGSSNFSQVSAGIDHTLALTTTRQLYAWGNNNTYQTGYVNTSLFPNPVGTINSATAYSSYFNGTSSQWISVPAGAGTSGDLGAGDFTLECWTYLNSRATFYPTIFDNAGLLGNSNRLAWWVGHNSISTTTYNVYLAGGNANFSTAIIYNAWTHLALVRSGTTVKLFVNGVQDATTYTSAVNYFGITTAYIGGSAGDAANCSLKGNISNFRIVRGQALYSGTFTPSTSPLTNNTVGSTGSGAASSITGTVTLLTCQNTTFIDNSGNSVTISTSGTPTAGQSLTPFPSAITPISTGSFTQIAAGNSHSLAVDSNSKLYAWGDNTVGQLGTNASLEYWSSVHIGIYSTTAYAIRNDGLLYSWGSDSSGNFGTNNAAATQRSSPVQIGTSSWSMIAAGRSHTLAIKADGTLWAWGANVSGELADAIQVGGARSSPVQLGTSSWSFITAGYASSAGVDVNGKLYTWGINTSGLLGTNDTLNRSNVTQIGTPTSWTQVGFTKDNAGSTFAIRSDGSLFTWGPGGLGQLGDSTTLTRSSPVQVHTGVRYTSISGGTNSMLGIRGDKTLWAWGFNNVGQLGDNTIVNKSSPIQIAPGYVFKQVAAGSQNVLALTTGGLLFGWGSNGSGQMGISDILNRSSPVQIGTLLWEFLSTGNATVFGITRGALPNLYGWGDPITSGTTPARSSPVQVQAMTLYQFVSSPTQLGTSSWTSVSAGASYSLGVNSAGSLYVWGDNTYGQLGVIKSATAVNTPNSVGAGYIRTIDNNLLLWGYGAAGQLGDNQSAGSKSNPVNVTQLSGVKFKDFAQVKSSVSGYTLAISTNNNLWAWGANNNGALGNNSIIFRSMPIQIGASSWTSVAVGLNFSIALKSDNTLWGWGVGYPAAGAVSWQSVSAGASHTLILRSDKQLFGFGSNTAGQLGDNTVVAKSSPTVLHAGVLYNSIAAGTNISAGIREDNTLWTWGINTNGALGLGDTLNRSSPVQVTSVTNDFWSQVTASDYMLAQSSTFGIYGWGLNTSGQLGNNTIVSRSSPVQLPFAGSIYSNYGSNFFNGSGAYLSTVTANTAFAFGTGDYTIEAWVYRTDSGVQRAIVDLRGGANLNVLFYMLSSNKLAAFNSTSTWITSTNIIPLNAWTHVALTRTGTSATLFINGTVDGTATNSNNNVSIGTPFIGRQNGSTINDWLGYISNVRVIKGTALYTSTFTPSTSPLTTTSQGATASEVSLLTCQSNSFIDNSNNAFTLTQNGVITLSGLNPFLAPSGVNNAVVELSAGSASYIVNYDNKLYAWGVNTNGQLGQNDTINRSSPVQIGTSSFTQVSAGSAHALAIRTDGILFGWGNSLAGQTGVSASYKTIANINGGGFLAIKADGSLWAWGTNASGVSGLNDSLTNRSSPIQVGTSSWAQITTSNGGTSAFGITTINTLYAWGINQAGQLGVGDVITRSSPVQIPGSWTTVIAQTSTTVAIDTTGKLFTWGSNTNYALGNGNATGVLRSSPVQIAVGSSFTVVGAAGTNGFAINTDGTLWGWGSNTNGELGQSDRTTRSLPVQIGVGNSWNMITGNNSSIIAIRNDNTLWGWGANGQGQIGLNDTITRSSPVQVGTSSWTFVFSQSAQTAAIRSDGAVYVWGTNAGGILGLNDTVTRSSPAQLGASVDNSFVTVGGANGSLIKSNGDLYLWGLNNTTTGLGFGTASIGRSSPVLLPSSTYPYLSSPVQVGAYSWSQVTAGNSFSAGIRSNGTLYTWGNNNTGQLGLSIVNTIVLDITNLRFSPSQVGTSSYVAVSAGGSQVVALTNDQPWQNLYTWGAGTLGLIGTNDTLNRSSPVQIGSTWLSAVRSSPSQISSSSDWSIISTADQAAYAIKSNGTLWTWGIGTNGRLGLNDTINRSSPTQIGSSSWTSVAGGRSFVAGITTDGTLYTWGQNTSGQLGQGHTLDRSTPTQIAGSYTYVSSGESHVVAIKSDGTTWAWGFGTSGQLGVLDLITRSSPVQVSTAVAFSTVTAGSVTSYGAKDNILYGWGGGTLGQLGDGAATNKSSPIVITSIWYNNDFAQSSPTQVGSDLSWSTVAAGANTSMALESTGELFVWGYNTSGQIGNNSTVSRSSIVQIGTSSFSIIAAGGVNAYAIKPTTYSLFGWGNGGTVGDNTAAGQSSPVQLFTTGTMANPTIPIELRSFLGSSYTQVQAGSSVVTVTSSNGLLFTWGNGVAGQLGTQNINVITSSPVLVGGQVQTFNASPAQISSNSYTQISAGYRHALAIKDDSTLYGWGNFAATAPTTDAYSWKKVAAGQNHFVAIRGDNTLWTWGLNTQGQLGTSDTVNRSIPVQIGTNTYSDIAAGASFTAAITTDYSLYAWGQNNTGQLGQGGTDTIARSSPVQLGASSLNEPTSYSTNFNGSQYFTVATNPAFVFGTGDFTIEAWFYIASGTAGAIFDTRSGAIGITPLLFFSSSTLRYYVNGTDLILSPTTLLSNRWYHVALVRSSGSSKMYLNGVQTGSTVADVNNFTLTNTINVGRGNDNANFLNGYISNLRVIKGTAIYTSSFIPSTSPLTTTSQGATASQVSLLTCQNKTLIDNSNNTFSISNVSTLAGQLISPFIGYSVFFGTISTDALTVPHNTALDLTSGNFTIDCWIYSITAANNSYVFNKSGAVGTNVGAYTIQYLTASGAWVFTTSDSTAGIIGTSYTFGTSSATNGVWKHLAVTRSGTTITTFLNGAIVTSITQGVAINDRAQVLTIGNQIGSGGAFNGYISNLRIVKGTALYSTAFIPSIYNLPAVSGTSLLTCNSSIFVDYSSNNFTITTIGAPAILQTENPITYNASSISFNGTSQFLTVVAGAPGSGNYTIECWIYTSDYYNAAAYAGIFDSRASGSDAGGISLYYKRAGALLIYRVAGTDLISVASSTTQLNGWNHIAVVRNGGTVTMYINGVSAGSASNTTNHTNTSFWIGKTFDPYYFGGYISNFRMVYGSAVYTGDFTALTNPLTAITNTVLLTCQNPIIVDNSINAFTITTTGAPVEAAPKYTPFTAYLGTSSSYLSVKVGMSHAIALASDNTLYVWGYNANGQLGIGNTTSLYQPTQITPTVSYVNITAGANHTGAIDTNQNLYLWGFNVGGQLGQSNIVARSSPTQVGTLKWSSVVAVGIGTTYDFTMALRTDGTLWSWGYNTIGQLGINLTTNRSSPVQVGSEYWSSIYDGSNVQAGAVLAEKSDGLLFAWGLNSNGQLGLNDTLNRSSPVQLSTSFKFANSGAYSTDVGAFFDTTGQMYTAGNDAAPSGELGNGSRIARSSPVQIASYYPTSPIQISSDSWTQVSAGNDLSLGIRTNNSLYAWGLNTNYQTGIGTGQAIVSSPVQIGTTISSASAGTTAGGYIKNA